MPGGRPPRELDQSTADEICTRISSGQRLRQICKELNTSSETIYFWMARNEEFAKQYADAKQKQAESMADEMMEIADSAEFTNGDYGNAAVQAARLQVDTRKWLLSKLLPKKYGDRIQNEVTGAGGAALNITVTGIPPTPENT
jgi:hypothetical protein